MSRRMPRHNQTRTEPVANTSAGSAKNAHDVSDYPVVRLARVGRDVALTSSECNTHHIEPNCDSLAALYNKFFKIDRSLA